MNQMDPVERHVVELAFTTSERVERLILSLLPKSAVACRFLQVVGGINNVGKNRIIPTR